MLALALVLIACAPAQAPSAEIPATEPPADTEELLPEVTRITFVYEYNYVPENWVKNKIAQETINFYPSDNQWTAQTLTPVFQYMGPLFIIQLDGFENKVGSCAVYMDPLTNTDVSQQLTAKPNCHTPNLEETVYASVRLPNCGRDSNLKLTCRYPGVFGVLQYTLNKNQDVFEFQYSGSWDLSFEYAMNTSLELLGFTSPSAEFYRSTEPNKIYTIKKE